MHKENAVETVRARFLAALRALRPHGGVLVALSGGADSVCLFDLFCEAAASGDFPYAIATAHIDHSLRGAESDRDAAFCAALAAKHGVRHFVRVADVASLAKENGRSIEEEARAVRYGFFAEVLSQNEDLCHAVTAHHAGDLCETMLFNLARGCGIDGLCSIPRVRGNILRPLLDCSRAEILAYNEARGLSFVTDSTNDSVEYSRNRIRHNVLPELSAICEGYADNMARTAALLRQDADFLRTEAEKAMEATVADGVLDTQRAQNLHPALLSRIVKILYNRSVGMQLSEVHVRAITEQITQGKSDFTLSLPGGVCICTRGALSFTSDLPQAADFCLPVTVGTPVALPNGLTVTLSKTAGGTPLSAAALQGALTLRSRRDGDTMRQFGKTHKLRRMIADKKLSPSEKATLFFLCREEEILYTNLPAISDTAFCKPEHESCIYIKIEETL